MTTMVTATSDSYTREAFETFLAGRDEPDWMTDQRRQAFEAYRGLLETPLDLEEYKRVDARTFRPSRYHLQEKSADETGVDTLMQHRAEYAGQVTHVDGHTKNVSLDLEMAEKGVLFGDLATMLRDHEDKLRPYFMTRAVLPDADRFSAWHAAFWTGGAVLYVPRNVALDRPLHSLIALQTDGAADFSHTLVILEDGAEATLLEETASANNDATGMHVGAVELLVGRNARLRYVQLQNWNHKVYHFAHQCGRVGGNGSLQWTVGGLGSRLAHIHQDVMLDERGAEAQVNGVTFTIERQVLSYYTKQAHNAEDTTSDLLYKEVLRDDSRCIWRGMIRVEPEAQKTDGYQRSDALMLSSTCRADSIPGLEIEADDVRCTHGATGGRVDEEQLFYCMCRGLSRFEAMHVIVEGFFQQVFDRIPTELVRETLSQAVERKLGIGD